jgi:hypothetical protein
LGDRVWLEKAVPPVLGKENVTMRLYRLSGYLAPSTQGITIKKGVIIET